MNVKVRIRDAESTTDVPLMEWPLDRVEELPKVVQAWGVYTDLLSPHDVGGVTGQFVVGTDDAYFLLVVHGRNDGD